MTASGPIDAPTAEARLRTGCHGTPPLAARLEPWMQQLLADPQECADLVAEFGSPVNLHDFAALSRNVDELRAVADEHGLELGTFVARKANKTLGLVTAAAAAGLGVDVGSRRELTQALQTGLPAGRVVVTAAVKPPSLLRLALDSGALLVLDNLDEAAALQAESAGRPAPEVALRLAPTPGGSVVPTRFGESTGTWLDWARRGLSDDTSPTVAGIHFHLHGYDVESRVRALDEAVALVDALRELGHRPGFVDIGGGLPMSYLDSEDQWREFWAAHDRQNDEDAAEVTWRREPLRQVYPYRQRPVRGAWLRQLLSTRLPGGDTAATALRQRGLQLRCEPGRSVLDGCGMTLARVIQRTGTSDGVPLVGLEMNRTQCRSTSDDFLVDPILIESGRQRSAPFSGYLVGAYCIEAELILRRRFRFDHGVAVGDLLALPNTGGYLMHILESASHQIPLASNVVAHADGWQRDPIDTVSPVRDLDQD